MNQLPMDPLSPDQQHKRMEQMYRLLEKQVQSYHKHRHMGEHSSVRVELAQELADSMAYTIDRACGIRPDMTAEEALRLGQKKLEETLEKAVSMLELVHATAPRWQSECRWEALTCLGRYLDRYDPSHLAHWGPDDLYYPILISPPEGIRGIDSCLFYLNILWIENQIMAGIPDNVLARLWDRLPTDTHNPCEQLLLNGIGKVLIGADLDPLTFTPEERISLMRALPKATGETLKTAARRLCQMLNLKDAHARMYAEAVIPLLTIRLGPNGCPDRLTNLFL